MIQFPDTLRLVGQKLGPYVVRQVATMGGVAIIYRGEHEALHSAVAIKVLTPELVEDAVRPTLEQMFLREAQILSQLRSDDILRALDHGQVVCGDGKERPYIVVDWMDGKPLSEDIDRRRLEGLKAYDIEEAIETLEPIARALAYAHGSGIVHRDVNPRNVFLENVGSGKPRAKLIDFGFAKEVARTEALRLQNVDGTLMARSPDYAAPEHYDREAFGELSENTDIYTFALMIVEMLTLQPPLHGASDAELQVATANRSDRPTPNRRGAHVSDSVEKLFSEALAVDQFDRPGVLLDWWERLKTAVSGDGQAVPELSPPAGPKPPAAAPDVSSPTIDISGPIIEVSGDASEPLRLDERVAPSPSDADLPQNWGAPAAATGKRSRGIVIALAGALVAGGALGAFLWYQHRPLDCPSGSADCNGNHSDGCETNLLQDPARCGACAHTCAAGEVCTEGKCQSGRCPLDHLRDCNKVASDGCEVDVRTDSKNCGECGRVCGQSGSKQAACVDSACEISCRAGFGNCDGAPENGCEALFSTDAKHCGRCGFACVNASCSEGVCAPKLLVGPLRIHSLHARGDTLYFWDADDRRIDRVSVDGLRGTVADHVDDLTGLIATADRVVWSGGPKNEIFARLLDGGPITRVSGPLTSSTPIFISTAGYVSWANRARRSDEPTGASPPGRARAGLSPPPTPRSILFAPVDSLSDKARVATADCNQWPAAFAGGPDGQYCCDKKQPVTLVECKGTNCAYRPLGAACPDVFADDGDRIYFAEETRVVALDRKSSKLDVLAKRKRQPRAVTVGGDYVYWLEGDPLSDIFRIKKDAKDPTLAEMIARRQVDAVELSASDRAAFWTARPPADAAGAKGAKPAAQKGSKPGQAGHGSGAPGAAYVVVFPKD